MVTVTIDINNRGHIVGYFTLQGAYRAFLYDGKTFMTLPLPPGADNQSFALGINEAGRIVGYFNSATGVHGFLANPTHRR